MLLRACRSAFFWHSCAIILLLQGGHHLLLVRHSALQLLDMLLFAVLAQLELLHAPCSTAPEQRLVVRSQREVAIAHHQLHPGRVVGGALQLVVRVIAQERVLPPERFQQAGGGCADDGII